MGKVDQLLGLCDELAARQAARREARERLVGATLDRLVSARSAAEFPAHAHRLRDHFNHLFDTPPPSPNSAKPSTNSPSKANSSPKTPTTNRPATKKYRWPSYSAKTR